MNFRIGIDCGGTKIEGLAMDPTNRELFRLRVPTPRGDYEGTLNAIVHVATTIEDKVGARATIGVGTPGSASKKTGRMKNSNSTWLLDKPLLEDLKRKLGSRVRIANDANCFALSEAKDGAGKDQSIVFGVIIGTGVGGGLVVNETIVEGPNSITGEWGHNPLPWIKSEEAIAKPCYCGQQNCNELFLSGPGLESDYFKVSGNPKKAAEINATLLTDKAASQVMENYYDRLARGLSTLINSIDPDVIVLGGGLSNMMSLYEEIPQRWSKYVFSDVVDTQLKKALHGDSGGVRGAAWLWSPQEAEALKD